MYVKNLTCTNVLSRTASPKDVLLIIFIIKQKYRVKHFLIGKRKIHREGAEKNSKKQEVRDKRQEERGKKKRKRMILWEGKVRIINTVIKGG